MARQLKLVWEFRGQDALQTARHHEIHLNEFCKTSFKKELGVGIEKVSEHLTVAYVIVKEEDMPFVRDNLKPHRAFVYNPD